MEVTFHTGFPFEGRGEIDAILQRIAIGDKAGHWRELPDEIQIRKQLTGGRSGSEVLEVIVRRGNHRARKVVKLGPSHEVEGEFQAFQSYLQSPSRFFVPIEAATPGVLNISDVDEREREAVVYDHAARFAGNSQSEMQPFEDLARQAIKHGGMRLEQAIKALNELLSGMSNDLYEKERKVREHESSLQECWNLRLGIDAVVAIDRVKADEKKLEISASVPRGVELLKLWPLDIAKASVRVDSQITPGDRVRCDRARMVWRGKRLMAEIDGNHLRLEIVSDGVHPIDLTPIVSQNSIWSIWGRLDSLRMSTHRDRLLKGLGSDFRLTEKSLTGPEVEKVADPFTLLPDVLERKRSHRITSVIHGDLNPRNILIVDGSPYLIDYALTREKEPILMDFCRLEGCLARDVLPPDLSWKQHVRLQRLLAVACRLGDESALRFAEQLAADRPELASAFRLLWTIRCKARDIYPQQFQDQWERDYLEQLFLFAHLTLKWDRDEELVAHKLLATAAMAGVAAEALSDRNLYRFWNEQALRADGDVIIQILQSQPQSALRDLASLVNPLAHLDAQMDASVLQAFEQARATFVKQHFHNDALVVLNRLREDHEVYISLRAYINLKGQLRTGNRRKPRSRGKMLSIDELLGESEWRQNPLEQDRDVMELIAGQSALVLVGDAGSGKSTIAREWEYRLAQTIVEGSGIGLGQEHIARGSSLSRSLSGKERPALLVIPRMPIVLRAPVLQERLQDWKADDRLATASVLLPDADALDLLILGVHYVIVDALNELVDKEKQEIAKWIIALRKAFPRTPVLVCHRLYNYVPGLLPFPVINLQKVQIEQARRYVYDYLREKGVAHHERLAKQLVALLLDNPDHLQVRDLAQTPLFLWMLVEHYRQTEHVPESRGELFKTFSRWYLEQRYHEVHQELTATVCSYEDKALLLGVMGYELVQRRQTDLPRRDISSLVPQNIKRRASKILEEIIAAELLIREGEDVRFLHQSFQEYFAACHFLATQAKDSAAIRRKVRQFGWQDTFIILLGFAGETPEVVVRVIEEALKVNLLLTARCLRIAEQPDPHLLERFITMQEAILLDDRAGDYAHQQAAQALAEYGRGSARNALRRVVIAVDAPVTARVAALRQLTNMPSQVRFEAVADTMCKELAHDLSQIFDEPAPSMVQLAAIEAIVTVELRDLSLYLFELVTIGEWSLCRAAWKACHTLDLKITPRQQASFVKACRERLDKAEEELFRTSAREQRNALSDERVEILQHLVVPANLPLLLRRRFSFKIHSSVADMVKQVIERPGEPPTEAQNAWIVLTEQWEDTAVAIDRWLDLLRSSNDLVAAAAGHRLLQIDEPLPYERLRTYLDPDLPPDRLSAVARLIQACKNKSLVKPLEKLLRSLVYTITDVKEYEATANLFEVLIDLDDSLGRKLITVATTIFNVKRYELGHHRYFPWRELSARTGLGRWDYKALLAAGGDDAYAAIYRFANYGGHVLRTADVIESSDFKDDATIRQLQHLAKGEGNMSSYYVFAGASAYVQAVELLPWLLYVASSPDVAKEEMLWSSSRYGIFKECILAEILRAIGYLARVLLDQRQMSRAQSSVSFLRTRYRALQADEERSIVVGLTTALGYLGDWEPILTHLGADEPWMHEAAQNVFKHWVPTPLNAASPESQREAAVRWITQCLLKHLELPAQVRSTLQRIKDNLEVQLGYHVDADAE